MSLKEHSETIVCVVLSLLLAVAGAVAYFYIYAR